MFKYPKYIYASIISVSAGAAAILGIWAFPEQACSIYYADDVFTSSTPIGFCRQFHQWRNYSDENEVQKLVDGGQTRNFGQQCFDNSHCPLDSSNSRRCESLDSKIENAPRFCLAIHLHCPFPGLPGIEYGETKSFGSERYTCAREVGEKRVTKRYFVVREN